MGCSKCGEMLDTDLEGGAYGEGFGEDFGSVLPIPATGHKYYNVAAVEAGCATPGSIEHIACENCDKKFAQWVDVDNNYYFGELLTIDTLPTGVHKYAPATCEAPATCDCGDTKGEALGHSVVYAFDVAVSNPVTTTAIKAYVNKAVWTGLNWKKADDNSWYVEKTCEDVGFKNFKICEKCANDWFTEYLKEDDNVIEWAGLSSAEKLQKIAANAYVEGYEEIEASHNMINYFGTKHEVAGTDLKDNNGDGLVNDADVLALFVQPADVKTGEFIAATCETKGVMNFQVCKDCASSNLSAVAANYGALEALVTVQPGKTKAAVYAEGFEEATTAALGHNYVTAAGVNTYKAGVAATCTKDGWTEEYDCQRVGCDTKATKTNILH